MSSRPVAIAIGSNLGDRRAHVAFAIQRLAGLLTDLRVSRIIETEPVDTPDLQPPYLNAAAAGYTVRDPQALLKDLLAIEAERGRTRPASRAPRTLDLDLILYDDVVLSTPSLIVPHPRFRQRAFVLGPLVDIVPDWRDPLTGKTVRELFLDLDPAAGMPVTP